MVIIKVNRLTSFSPEGLVERRNVKCTLLCNSTHLINIKFKNTSYLYGLYTYNNNLFIYKHFFFIYFFLIVWINFPLIVV